MISLWKMLVMGLAILGSIRDGNTKEVFCSPWAHCDAKKMLQNVVFKTSPKSSDRLIMGKSYFWMENPAGGYFCNGNNNGTVDPQRCSFDIRPRMSGLGSG